MYLLTEPPNTIEDRPLSEHPEICARPLHSLIDNGNPKSIMYYGPNGSGKSTLVAAYQLYRCSQKKLCYWLDCKTFPMAWDDADDVLEAASPVRTLIVDDLGKEPAKMREHLRRLIFARFLDNRFVTLWTTNLTPSRTLEECELASTYGASVRSTLFGGATLLEYNGQDRRLDPRQAGTEDYLSE